MPTAGPHRRSPERLRTCRQRVADRKSTRLNSSHANISYAVFCLTKKGQQRQSDRFPPYKPREILLVEQKTLQVCHLSRHTVDNAPTDVPLILGDRTPAPIAKEHG